MHEIGVHVDLESLTERVADEPGQLRMKGRLSADELNGVHRKRLRIIDDTFPVIRSHGAVISFGTTVGVAMSALQLTEAGDLQF